MVDNDKFLDKKSAIGIWTDPFDERIGDGVYGSSDPNTAATAVEDDLFAPSSGVYLERMMLNQASTTDPKLYDRLKLLEQAEQYLAAYAETEKALNNSVPPFREMAEAWVENSLLESAGDEPITDLDRTVTYQALRQELEAEYQEFIDAGSVDAQAEWDAVREVIDAKISKHTYLDVVRTLELEDVVRTIKLELDLPV